MFSEEIINVLDKIGQKFGVALDWSSQNAVPKLQELSVKIINYTLTMNYLQLFAAIFMVAILIIAIIVTKKNWDWIHRNYYDDFLVIILAIVGGAISIIAITMVCCAVKTIITCYTFPEKIIFDYVRLFIS